MFFAGEERAGYSPACPFGRLLIQEAVYHPGKVVDEIRVGVEPPARLALRLPPLVEHDNSRKLRPLAAVTFEARLILVAQYDDGAYRAARILELRVADFARRVNADPIDTHVFALVPLGKRLERFEFVAALRVLHASKKQDDNFTAQAR